MLLRLAALIAAYCCAILMATSPAFAERRVALVIGNSAYKHMTPLANPAGDAARMAEILKQHGFDVLSCDGARPGCFDLDEGRLRDVLEDVEDRSAGAELALVFYAGHGMQVLEGNVLAPIDMSIDCTAKKARNEVLLQQVMDAIAGAQNQVVILDACRNDAVKQQCQDGRGAVQVLSFGKIDMPEAQRVLVVSSTKEGQLAKDGLPGQHSPFAQALFEEFERVPGIHFDQMLSRVATLVIRRTAANGFTQVPEWVVSGGAPQLCLAQTGCGADPEGEALRAELLELRKERERDQVFVSIAKSFLDLMGVRSGDEPLSEEERLKALKAIEDVGRSLANDFDKRGETALEKLKKGDSAAAEELLVEALAADEQAAMNAVSIRFDGLAPKIELLPIADLRRKQAAVHARQLATLKRWSDVDAALGYYRKATELVPENVWTWIDFGEAARDFGQLNTAKEAFDQAVAQANRMADLKAVIKANYRLGDVAMEQGNRANARRFYEAAVEISERYVAEAPDDLDRMRELSVSNIKIGDVSVDQGDRSGALEAYGNSLAIAERLATADPGNARWQRDLAIAHLKLAQLNVNSMMHWRRVVDILRNMQASGTILAADQALIAMAEAELAAAKRSK